LTSRFFRAETERLAAERLLEEAKALIEDARVRVDRDVTEVRTLLTLIGQEQLRVENARWTRWTGTLPGRPRDVNFSVGEI
jgi:hypothetical protein